MRIRYPFAGQLLSHATWKAIQHVDIFNLGVFVLILIVLGYLRLTTLQISAINDKVLHFLAFFLLTVQLLLSIISSLMLNLMTADLLLGARHPATASSKSHFLLHHSSPVASVRSLPILHPKRSSLRSFQRSRQYRGVRFSSRSMCLVS